jgi:hypothetical protein
MHGTFNDIATRTVIDTDFAKFIGSLYENKIVPPLRVVDDVEDEQKYFRDTGCVAVLSEDENEPCPVFGDWGLYYAFEGWLAYRALPRTGNEFQLMVADVLAHVAWSPETVDWINTIHALVVVQEKYADKFKHYPLDLRWFVTACAEYGAETVLLKDIY